MERRVVVTGCGVVSPVGTGKQPFWEALCSGKSGIEKITKFDVTDFKSQIAGEVRDFTPPTFLSFKDLKRTPRFVQFALKAAEEAITESGLDFNKLDLYRVGVIIGSGIGDLESVERECKIFFERGINKISPFLIPMLITNEAAGNVSIYFNLKGINFCTVTACASGTHAIGEGYLAIKYNRADVVICGGSEACITPMGVGGFCALKALSRRNDKPKEASRPFDKDRDGFVIAEGAGIVVLEELEHAQKRGASIYGEICGYGATSDAYHITAPQPEGEAPAKAMELAIKEANVSIDEDIYINAHGTSTELNDKIETKAIKRVFGANAYKL
ncbi:MAG: beta-ketoacyl-[acyl-carrier-protein] synthase II, partial [Candidatus Omnitrophica bacterium]|nr:beta-ketoacyl-[acyl-carrier-protein] synthase II [Candidatus Omnitrophota bacterium]